MPQSKNEAKKQRSHILKTLEFISNNSEFVTVLKDQIRFVYSAYSKLRGNRRNEWDLEFPQLEIPISNGEIAKHHHPTLLIGGKIEGKGEEIMRSSFSACITFETISSPPAGSTNGLSHMRSLNIPSCCLNVCQNKRRIVRRFHFDFNSRNHKKPTSHFQYGGKFPENEQYKDWHYCLEYFLEKPRFHYPPMDLVLLFDLLLWEFETPLKKLIEEPFWKSLVVVSQNWWWKDYWNKAAGYLNNPDGRTFHERVYTGTDES